MKAITVNEMRAVEGGKTYTFNCSKCHTTLNNLNLGQYVTAKILHAVGIH
ncbi:MAG: hypothetical protein LUF77_05615 [Oscillospiraceae bacterium]|nr:hypothetical protein [Oscillospiraceae bacterium]MCD7934776.1 hypothetical protein [Oscillospiraceae bacterium]